mmetsp:Transcript_50795/g.94985  ORF Transcript_50795/g.94985 Transcript_50795/m.94985 type:complete len:459 (+) Transcript_50795:48-1424(+)
MPWTWVASLLGSASAIGCLAPANAPALLQKARQTHQAGSTPAFHYDARHMWNLDKANASWKQTSSSALAPCQLHFVNASGVNEVSQLSLGACMSVWKPVRTWRLDLALPASGGRTSPGKNPAFVALPSHLETAFPDGKWMAVGRAGWMRCPGMEDYPMGHPSYMFNTYCTGSYAAVLDSNFRVLERAKIQVDSEGWEDAVMDVRLILHGGDILVSFMAYCLRSLRHIILAPLHVEAASGRLSAKLERAAMRRVKDCAHADSPKKNLGLLERHGTTYLLDHIYPTVLERIELPVAGAWTSEDTTLSDDDGIRALCVQPETVPESLQWQPWKGVVAEGGRPTSLHNGPSPVWLPDFQVFLGLGHIRRGEDEVTKGYVLPHHYSHQFYTISGQYPFRLIAVTPEFCFSSAQDPDDCENIQFASSLLLEGSSLLVGVGIQDCDSFVYQFQLEHVLGRLVDVE